MTERERDARDLLILHLYAQEGVYPSRIAEHPEVALKTNSVRKRVREIRNADCAHDPEAALYWGVAT